MAELRAYAALAGGQVRSAASYRASFLLDVVSSGAATVFDVLTVIVLFRATRSVAGFGFAEGLLIAGLSSLGFALADFTVGNIDRLKTHVRAGTLDAVLVRPLSPLAQLILMDLPVRKVLRLVVALSVLVVALRLNDVDWTPGRVVLLVATPLCGALFFGAIFVLSASVSFWWVDSGEVGHAFTYGGRDFTAYPLTVYSGWFRSIFAYGLGFGFVAYQPALALLGRTDPLGLPVWAGYTAPLVAPVAALVAALVWRTGIRHYRSTGS